MTSDSGNRAQVNGVIVFIQRLQSATRHKMKLDVTFGVRCVIEIH